MNDVKKTFRVLESIINQQLACLENISQEQYTTPVPSMDYASIGGHTRHIAEFLVQLIKDYEHGTISYDDRERDKNIETDPKFASRKFKEINRNLAQLPQKKLYLKQIYGEETLLIETTLDREVVYNIEHTIHHQALIKVALNHFNLSHIVCGNFGVAPSTIKFREQIYS